jgi:hypothetical protein
MGNMTIFMIKVLRSMPWLCVSCVEIENCDYVVDERVSERRESFRERKTRLSVIRLCVLEGKFNIFNPKIITISPHIHISTSVLEY